MENLVFANFNSLLCQRELCIRYRLSQVKVQKKKVRTTKNTFSPEFSIFFSSASRKSFHFEDDDVQYRSSTGIPECLGISHKRKYILKHFRFRTTKRIWIDNTWSLQRRRMMEILFWIGFLSLCCCWCALLT